MEHYSISRLNCFLDCPRKFYYQYVRNIKVPSNIYLRSGKAFHLILEYINNQIKSNQEIKDLDKVILFYSSENNLPKNYVLSFQMYSDYYIKRIVPSFEGKIYGVEKEFHLPVRIEGENFTFKGVMDLILYDGTNYILYDFKTKKSQKKPELANDLQMQFYSYILSNFCSFDNNNIMFTNKGIQVRKHGHIQFCERDSSVMIFEDTVFKFPDILSKIKTTINYIEDAIKYNIFPCTRNRLCDYCDYSKICRGH